MTIEVVNPLDIPNWDDLVRKHPNYSVFHSSGWARVLLDTYGFLPYYLCEFKGEVLSSCLPIMEVNSFLTGREGVSLPFSDFCQPLLNESTSLQPLLDYASRIGKDRGWKYLELRGSDEMVTVPASEQFSHHVLALSPGVDKLFRTLRGSNRRNIKKAVSEGVRVRIGCNANSIKNYYRLHSLTRKRHGLPPQPYRFFKMLYQHQIANGHGFVASAEYQGRQIAGAVFLTFGDQAIFKFGASDIKYYGFRPNNLVMWEAIRRLVETGFNSLSFGRTDLEHKGLIQFKSGWGGKEKVSTYTRFDFKTGSYVPHVRTSHPLYSKMFQKAPIPLLKVFGNLFYKHFGI